MMIFADVKNPGLSFMHVDETNTVRTLSGSLSAGGLQFAVAGLCGRLAAWNSFTNEIVIIDFPFDSMNLPSSFNVE